MHRSYSIEALRRLLITIRNESVAPARLDGYDERELRCVRSLIVQQGLATMNMPNDAAEAFDASLTGRGLALLNVVADSETWEEICDELGEGAWWDSKWLEQLLSRCY